MLASPDPRFHNICIAFSFPIRVNCSVYCIRCQRMLCTLNLNDSRSKWAGTKRLCYPILLPPDISMPLHARHMCIYYAWPVYPPHPVDCYIRFPVLGGCLEVHSVDTNFFLGGVSCAVFPYTSRGRFRWKAHCNAPDADRIVRFWRLYCSGHEWRWSSHCRFSIRAMWWAEMWYFSATMHQFGWWIVSWLTTAINNLPGPVGGGVVDMIGRRLTAILRWFWCSMGS